MALTDKHIAEIIQSHKNDIYQRFHVESLSIFGSVCKGTARLDSDVDILVRYSKTPGIFSFLDLKHYLESILDKPVDLVTEGALKENMRQEILKEAIRVA
jgi:hypothetical protein